MSRLSNARTELENYEKTRPADYVSQYQPKIKDVMGQLDGMKEFDYDPDADTAYQQYKSQYTRSAKLAEPERTGQCRRPDRRLWQQLRHPGGPERLCRHDEQPGQRAEQPAGPEPERIHGPRTGLETRLNGLQNAEKQDYQNYQNDYSNWLNGLQYRQNQYNSASSEHQQRTSNVLNGILSAVGLAAQILPWFFV